MLKKYQLLIQTSPKVLHLKIDFYLMGRVQYEDSQVFELLNLAELLQFLLTQFAALRLSKHLFVHLNLLTVYLVQAEAMEKDLPILLIKVF